MSAPSMCSFGSFLTPCPLQELLLLCPPWSCSYDAQGVPGYVTLFHESCVSRHSPFNHKEMIKQIHWAFLRCQCQERREAVGEGLAGVKGDERVLVTKGSERSVSGKATRDRFAVTEGI